MPFRKLPKKIDPCPIIDAIIELQLESSVPSEAFFGLLYNRFGKDFPQLTKLPILQLPDVIRESDPSLLSKPHHKLSNDRLALQIGPRVLSISSHPKYVGWSDFSRTVYKILDDVNNLKVIKRFTRLGIRYLNFFEMNIFDQVTLQITMDNSPLKNSETTIRTIFESGDLKSKLNIGNDITVIVDKQKKRGSIIDIDVITDKGLENIKDTIEKCHLEEKRIFFSLLKEDYERTLNPSY